MFLQLYNKSHEKVAGLAMTKAAQSESVLSTGDKTLSFSYPLDQAGGIVNEAYLRTEADEFVIKEVLPDSSNAWVNIKAVLNVEALQGQCWPKFESIEQKIDDCLTLAIAGTGWTIGSCTVTKRRTLRKTGCSTWEIISQAQKTYTCNIWFDSLKKQIHISEKRGQDKGVYFTDNLNLKKLSIQSTSHDFCTRIRAEGKDGLTFASINGGKNYVENHQYSTKNLEIYWKDERYTVAENLLEDATTKLEALSKPVVAYSGEIIDLAKAHPETYTILDFGLGDTVELVDSTTGTKEKQRIVKMVEYPDEPEKNTCEFANRTASFEELQQEQNEVNSTVGNITADDGTISPSALDLDAISIHVQNIYAQELNAVKARIGDLEVTTLKATEAIISTATIETLLAEKATIVDLTAVTARIEVAEIKVGYIDTLVSDVADIRTLVNGNLTSVNIQAGGITSDSLTIRNGFINNAMISNVEAGKITAGILNTAFVEVQGTDGRMAIKDNTIQIKDANRVRVQIGKDATGDYSMYVWDAAGSLMFDATGLHAPGIKSGIIRNDMVANNANIAGTKIDITSLITSINGNTTKIDSTVIKMDSNGQTLNLAFNTLKTIAETTKSTTETHTTQINTVNGKIDTLIQDTTIVRDGQTLKLKDEYNKTVATVGGIQTTIGNQQTTITNIASDFNNLSIGGRNLLYDSEKDRSTTRLLEIPVYDILGDYIGREICVSFEAKGSIARGVMVYAYQGSGTTIASGFSFTMPTERFERFSFKTKVVKSIIPAGYTKGGIGFYDYAGIQDYVIRRVKIELGNMPTDWTPAPEDTQGQITEVKTQQATFQQTLNGFSTTVSSLQTTINSKADGGTVNSINSRVTSLETSLDGFKTTVSNTYQTKNIPDTRNTNENPQWYFANYPKQTITEFKYANIVGIGSSAVYGTLETKVPWSESSGGYPVQTFRSQSTATYERRGTSNTTWSEWKQIEDTVGAQTKADVVKNFLVTNYSTTTAMNSVIDQKANQITLSVSQTYTTKTDFNNLTVGGRNYYKKTTPISISGASTTVDRNNPECPNGFYTVGVKEAKGNWRLSGVIESNGYWTISFEVRGSQSTPVGFSIDICDVGSMHVSTTANNTWKKVEFTVNVTNHDANPDVYNFIDMSNFSWAYFYIRNIKIEKGQKATDWTPAPEDTDASILAVSNRTATLETNVSGITSRVTNVESKATTTATGLTNLTTRVSTAESKLTATSLITTFTTAINGGTKFTTTKFTMDNTGLTVKGGGLRIQNNAGINVLWADTNGNLKQRGDFYNYDTAGKLRASLTDDAVNFYDDNGAFVSNMGASNMNNNATIKGIRFYTGNNGKYFSWSFENSATPGVAGIGMIYAKEDLGASGWTKGLHVEDSLYVANGKRVNCSASEYIYLETPGYGNFSCTGNILFKSDGYITLGTKGSNIAILRTNNDEVRMYRNIFMNGSSSIMHIGASCDLFNVGTGDFFIRNSNNLHICCNSGVSINNHGNSGWTEVRASNFASTSQEKYKTNICEFSNAKALIRNSKIYEYNLKTDLERGIVNKNYGFIIERETPEQVTDHDNIAINLYSMAGIHWQATKEIILENDLRDAEIEHLQEEITALKNKIFGLEQRLNAA